MLFRKSLVAIVASFVSFVSFVSFSAQAAMISLAPNADAYVNAANAAANFGTDAQVLIKNDGAGSSNRKGYLRYDLSTLPTGEVVTSAALNVTFIESGLGGANLLGTNTFEVFGLNDGFAGETWGEGTINWNNAPANAAGGTAITASASSLGTFSITGHTGNVNFLGTGGDAVQNFLANSTSNDLVTFILVRLTDSGVGSAQNYVHAIASKEFTGGTGAFLDITSELLLPAPEPSTGLLLGLAACVLMPRVRRRRRA